MACGLEQTPMYATESLLSNALVRDAAGEQTERFLVAQSRDWDEVLALTQALYTPYKLKVDTRAAPSTTVYAAQIGAFTLSRLSFDVQIEAFIDQDTAGKGLALTLLQGHASYSSRATRNVERVAGESFVVDTSCANVAALISQDTQSLNLVFSHQRMAEMHEHWYGMPADQAMWQTAFKLGTGAASLLPLLDYAARCAVEKTEQVAQGLLGRHLEELIGMHLLSAWRQHGGARTLSDNAAPAHLRLAEDYMMAHLRDVPTREEVARAAGVSVRTLTAAFLQARGRSPMAFQREMRLRGVREELRATGSDRSVTDIAFGWGFMHSSQFAKLYRQRFGELPSQTLRRTKT